MMTNINDTPTVVEETRPKLLLAGPGQGCQGFIDNSYFDDIRFWSSVNDILGYDLRKIVQDKGPELNQTRFAQPAITAATIQDLQRLPERVIDHLKKTVPDFDDTEIGFVGNSLGEIPMSYGAGFCSMDTALKFADVRGLLMQEAIPKIEEKDKTLPFMSIAMNIYRKTIEEICDNVQNDSFGIVHPSNINADLKDYKQIVIAGNKAAVMAATLELEERITSGGIILLTKRKTSEPSIKYLSEAPGPFHTELMLPARQELEKRIDEFDYTEEPRVPSGKKYILLQTYPQAEVKSGKNALYNIIRQIPNPIELCKTISSAVKRGFKYCFECGPGGSLGAIIKRRGGFHLIKKKDITV